ncbi:MAG: helix-turn-helix transcriptional regulator [Clostridia bacterium]|nr:helix-turn-helix transcriptional regulator [Clostridia bacterium]
MATFKERLKELRLELGLSQKSLAHDVGTTDDCIYFWEKGRSEPSISEIIALAKRLDVSTDYLLGATDEY